MEKVDYKKRFKTFYAPSKRAPEIVEVPEMQFLMIDGHGTTESDDFKEAIQVLFGVSFKAKFVLKKQSGFDYTVMPLEGLWWADDMTEFEKGNKENWKWTLMIFQPEAVNHNIIQVAIDEMRRKEDLPSLEQIRLECVTEGLSAQILHIGPFSEEDVNIARIHACIDEQGGTFDGHIKKHHEIYLSDFRKVDPEKMRTVLRQPFTKSTGSA